MPNDPVTPIWLQSEEAQRRWWAEQFPNGAPGATPAETAENTRAQRFAQVSGSLGVPNAGVTKEFLTHLFEQSGIDIENVKIQLFIDSYNYTDPEATDEEKQSDIQTAQMFAQMFGQDPELQKAGAVTEYSQALEASGFSGPLISSQFATAQLGGVPAYQFESQGPTVQPETGWMQYPNGVLVNKADTNPESAVIFRPNSMAPGSSWWYDAVVTKWSAEEISKWRNRLVDLGYLPKGSEKTEGLDQNFRWALSQYHMYRYYNGGKPIAMDASAGGPIHPTLTPKDQENRVRNNVRQQFLAVFNDDPSDAELESWTRFTLRQATELQREYMRRGVDESTALSNAVSEAGEMTANRLWENPVATYQRETNDENTKLHDGLMRAISATEGLLG